MNCFKNILLIDFLINYNVLLNFSGSPYRGYEPVWFTKQEDKFTDSLCHMYNHEYWECKSKGDWSRCPNIF